MTVPAVQEEFIDDFVNILQTVYIELFEIEDIKLYKTSILSRITALEYIFLKTNQQALEHALIKSFEQCNINPTHLNTKNMQIGLRSEFNWGLSIRFMYNILKSNSKKEQLAFFEYFFSGISDNVTSSTR